MNLEPDPDLMLLYVAGAAEADECARIEAKLCSGCPTTQGAYVEALAVFHAVPLGLSSVQPPKSCHDAIFLRVNAELAASDARLKIDPKTDYATRFRWPLYMSSGLAACLAVALTMSLWNMRQMEGRVETLASGNQELTDENSKITATMAASEEVLRSPHVTLASMGTQDHSGSSFGRVLFCPVTKRYQVTVFNLKPLPPGRGYELWLITPDQRKVPAGMLAVDSTGRATIIASPNQPVDAVAASAITDEPIAGSQSPTGAIQLFGALPAQAN